MPLKSAMSDSMPDRYTEMKAKTPMKQIQQQQQHRIAKVNASQFDSSSHINEKIMFNGLNEKEKRPTGGGK
jgi:hypothetical protein